MTVAEARSDCSRQRETGVRAERLRTSPLLVRLKRILVRGAKLSSPLQDLPAPGSGTQLQVRPASEKTSREKRPVRRLAGDGSLATGSYFIVVDLLCFSHEGIDPFACL